jgi:hypothetical protein
MRTDDMSSVQSLCGAMLKLPNIKKPQSSFEDWARFLRDCDEAGISAVTDKGQFVTELGFALYRRWRWLAWSKERGLSFEAAQAAFDHYAANLPRKRDWTPPSPASAPQTPATPDSEAEADLYAHAIAVGLFE